MNDFYGGLVHQSRTAELTAEADQSRLARIARGSTAPHASASRGVRRLLVGALLAVLLVTSCNQRSSDASMDSRAAIESTVMGSSTS
jgi:hypothetical protein